MMGDERSPTPLRDRPVADTRQKRTASKPTDHGIAESLQRAYDATLAEPLPAALADLLRRLE